MTRLLDRNKIPKVVLTPDQPNMRLEARHAPVYGVSVLDKCLNPDCQREGPLDALMLGPLNIWPNICVICGEEGCGVFWAVISAPPVQTMWLQVDDGGDEVGDSDE